MLLQWSTHLQDSKAITVRLGNPVCKAWDQLYFLYHFTTFSIIEQRQDYKPYLLLWKIVFAIIIVPAASFSSAISKRMALPSFQHLAS